MIDPRRSYALVIGIGQRPEGDAPGMAVTESDARIMASALREGMGIPAEQVIECTGEQATCQGIKDALTGLNTLLAGERDGAELLWIYFSGHGVRLQQELFLLAYDTLNADIPGTALRGDTFTDSLVRFNAKRILVLLDCCHAGALTHKEMHQWPGREALAVDEQAFCGKANRVILSASHAGQVSYLSRPVSLFTYAIIEALYGQYLKPGDNNISLFDLAMYARERVVALSRQLDKQQPQQPQMSLLKQKQATENFLLVRRARGKTLPLPFDEPLTKLEGPGGKYVSLEEKVEADAGFRNYIEKFVHIEVKQSVGENRGAVVGENQGSITIINNNYGDTGRGAATRRSESALLEVSDYDKELIRKAIAQEKSLGVIYFKQNGTVLFQLPGSDKVYHYEVSSESFSRRITSLLHKVAIEEVLDDTEYDLLGMSLFNRLFPLDPLLRDEMLATIAAAFRHPESAAVQFQILFDEHSGPIASVPWEFLYVQLPGDKGFFLGERCAITRRRILQGPTGQQVTACRQLRILIMAAECLKESAAEASMKQVLDSLKQMEGEPVDYDWKWIRSAEDIAAETHWEAGYQILHLLGVGRQRVADSGPAMYEMGFPHCDDGKWICNEPDWGDVESMLDELPRRKRPDFVVLHACVAAGHAMPDLRVQESLEAINQIAFQLSSRYRGVVAMQAPPDTRVTPQFLNIFYTKLLRDKVFYAAAMAAIRGTRESMIAQHQPANKIIGMASVFADLNWRVEVSSAGQVSAVETSGITAEMDVALESGHIKATPPASRGSDRSANRQPSPHVTEAGESDFNNQRQHGNAGSVVNPGQASQRPQRFN